MLYPGYNRMRVLYILEILKDEGRELSRAEIHRILKERYGIENREKTITDILRDMMDCGLIESGSVKERKSKNKYRDGEIDTSMHFGYYIEPEFEDNELLWLIDNTIFSKQLSLKKSNALVKKLLKLGSKKLAQKVGSVEGMRQFYHTPNPSVSLNIDTLSSAIHEHKAVTFVMTEYQLDKSLKVISDELFVQPMRMIPYNGFYYLIAFDPTANGLRHYRIDKMKHVTLCENSIDCNARNSNFFIDEYLASHSLMQSGKAVGVKIKIPESQIGLVVDQFGDKFRVLDVQEEMATVSLSSNEHDLYLWALEHGDLVEVLEPQSVRNRIRVAVAEMHEKYSCKELDKYDIELIRAQRPMFPNRYWFGCPNVLLDEKTEWKELTQITDLFFKNNNIKDFTFVKTLRNLRRVSFEKDQVNDLTFLFKLPRLNMLWLTETNVSDISCLVDLSIEHLKLVRNKELKDYSVLRKMNSLRLLYIDSETAEKFDVYELKKLNPKLEIVVNSRINGDVVI